MQSRVEVFGSLGTRLFLLEREALNTVLAALQRKHSRSVMYSQAQQPRVEMSRCAARGGMEKWSPARCEGSGVRFTKAKLFLVHKRHPPTGSLEAGRGGDRLPHSPEPLPHFGPRLCSLGYALLLRSSSSVYGTSACSCPYSPNPP